MVGGIVIEVAEVRGRSDVLFVDCRDTRSRDTCAVYLEKNETSDKIQVGDSIWWQDRVAMWTPSGSERLQGGVDCDIRIPRVGYSGVVHPFREAEQAGGAP